MLRNTLIFLGVCAALLCAFVWSEHEFSHSFIGCTSEQHGENPAESADYRSYLVYPIQAQITCSLRLIDQHNGFFAALAAIAVAGFTFTLWISTDKQARLTAQSIKLAREEFIATHRPKIIVHAAELRRDLSRAPGMQAEEHFLGASLIGFNVGESVARNVEVRGQIISGSNFAVDVQRPVVMTISWVLGGQKLRAEIKSDIPIVTAAMGKRTGIDYHCVGWIAYFDDHDQRRETGFCLRVELWEGRERWVSAAKPEYEYQY
jgi:hypothetical protein